MKRKTLAGLSLLLLLGGCSKNNGLTNNFYEELKVKAIVANSTQTKAIIYDDRFPEGAGIGVQLLKLTDGAAYSAKTNVLFTSDGAGNWSSTETYILNPLKAKVYGYYPYVSLADNSLPFTTIPVSITAKAGYNSDTDYMFATPVESEASAVYNSNNTISLRMNHALAQISMLVYKDNYNGDGSLTDFFIEDAIPGTGHILINADPVDFTMDITNGLITGGVEGVIERNLSTPVVIGQASSDPKFPSDDLTELKAQVLAKGVSTMVVPTSTIGADEIKFSFVIDGNRYSVNNLSSITWEKGRQYIYTIRLSGTSLTISQVTIAQWETELADDLIIY
ncbi:MAG: fimbrillin family protein [Bacteroidales bacterium]|jgi:hypothetical protein|nr:fimbrillin family protein [Bacteroidales bacterium]